MAPSSPYASDSDYFWANPQVFLLFLARVVLGLGTFIAVLVALVQSGNTTPSGEPSGVIGAASAMVAMLGSPFTAPRSASQRWALKVFFGAEQLSEAPLNEPL